VVSIVGKDEIDLNRHHISWVSPPGPALIKSAAGDSVVLQLPGGTENLSVLEVRYPSAFLWNRSVNHKIRGLGEASDENALNPYRSRGIEVTST
jgi:hypothetical protein